MEPSSFDVWGRQTFGIPKSLLGGWVTFYTDFWMYGSHSRQSFYLWMGHFLESLLDGLGKFKIEFWMDWAHSGPIYGWMGHIRDRFVDGLGTFQSVWHIPGRSVDGVRPIHDIVLD